MTVDENIFFGERKIMAMDSNGEGTEIDLVVDQGSCHFEIIHQQMRVTMQGNILDFGPELLSARSGNRALRS